MNDPRSNATIRGMLSADIPSMVNLQRQVFPELLRWTEQELTQHLSVFPEGQLVATDDSGKIIGSASSLIIVEDKKTAVSA